jgi:DNA polymerase-3 subunit delta'
MAFSQIQNQPSVELLQRSIHRGRLGHAYLFSGADMGLLEKVAANLAKTLNCASPVSGESCDRCSSCRRIDECLHPDVIWTRPESKMRIISIDQVRDVLQTVHLKATEGKYKVFVFVAADRLNVQAANAFLKTLEEPPAQTVFILLSLEPQKMLETILSRCLRLSFSEAEETLTAPKWLIEVAEMLASDPAGILARYRVIERLLAELAARKTQVEEELTKRSPLEKYDDLDSKVKERFEDELTAAIEAEYRLQRSRLFQDFYRWFRDLWALKVNGQAASLLFENLEDASRRVASRLSPEQAIRNLDRVERTYRLLHTNIQEALCIEVGLLELEL